MLCCEHELKEWFENSSGSLSICCSGSYFLLLKCDQLWFRVLLWWGTKL